MKKLIFFLLFTVSFYGQTYQNPTYGTVTEKSNSTDNTPAYFTTTQVDGVHKKTPAALIAKTEDVQDSLDLKQNISVPQIPLNYISTTPTVEGHFNGIDTKLGTIVATTADALNALNVGKENVANKQNSLAVDGTGDKYPTVDAVNNGVILQDESPQTKTGGLIIGGINTTNSGDSWIAFGTSVTFGNTYTVPMSAQLNTTLINYGVSGSTSNNLASQYVNIPTWTTAYRLLSIEHSINDSAQSVPLSTFRTNLENCIANAKGKGWPDNRILIINGNYCTVAPMDTTQEAYADEAILIAKEQGVQYVDIYNYTKNNGGGTLLADGIHPTATGGKVYAKGVIASMQGGGEFSSALTVTNGVRVGNLLVDNGIVRATSPTTSAGTYDLLTRNTSTGYEEKISPTTFVTIANAEIITGRKTFNPSVSSSGGIGRGTYMSPTVTATANSDILTGLDVAPNFIVGAFTGVSTWAIRTSGNIVPSSTNSYSLGTGSRLWNAVYSTVSLTNSLTIATSPTTSAGTYDLLTRNTSTGVVEKITAIPQSLVTNLTTDLAAKAALSSPAFTGTPTAPTATAGTNTTQIATTAFVQDEKNLIAHWTKTGDDIQNNNTGLVSIKGDAINNKIVFKSNAGVEEAYIQNGRYHSNLGIGIGSGSLINSTTGENLQFVSNQGNLGASQFIFKPNYLFWTSTGGETQTVIDQTYNINPTSGNINFNMQLLKPIINQTGGANGITRGIYINPTLTSAADFRAIEVTAGKVIVPVTTETAVQEYADNAAAITAGLAIGTHYRTGDLLKIVH